MMTLFLGLMKVAEAGGLLSIIARLLRPLMQRLFPQVPPTVSQFVRKFGPVGAARASQSKCCPPVTHSSLPVT